MVLRKIFIFLSSTILITTLGTITVIALGSEDSCEEPKHYPPTVITLTSETDNESTLENKIKLLGQVNPEGSPTTAWFQYGKTKALNTNTGYIYLGKGKEMIEVKISTKELKPDTTYYYKIVSENKYGLSYGDVESLRTENE
jgi:hypothetical protein